MECPLEVKLSVRLCRTVVFHNRFCIPRRLALQLIFVVHLNKLYYYSSFLSYDQSDPLFSRSAPMLFEEGIFLFLITQTNFSNRCSPKQNTDFKSFFFRLFVQFIIKDTEFFTTDCLLEIYF